VPTAFATTESNIVYSYRSVNHGALISFQFKGEITGTHAGTDETLVLCLPLACAVLTVR